MKVRWILIAAVALAVPSGAAADTTAVYALDDNRMTMTVQIAADGDLRVEMGGKMLDEMFAQLPAEKRQKLPKGIPGYIARDGEGYFLQPAPEPNAVAVIPIKDASAVLEEYLAARRSESPRTGTPAEPRLIKGETVIVNGRSGTAYYSESRRSDGSKDSSVVISSDPKLAELARAMSAQFEMSLAMAGRIGLPSTGGGMGAVLKTGAPLEFAGMKLVEVRHDEIPAERFALPAPPLSRGEVRSLMERRSANP